MCWPAAGRSATVRSMTWSNNSMASGTWVERLMRQAGRMVGAGCLALLFGCAQQPPRALPGDIALVPECAGDSAAAVGLSVSSLPIGMPPELAAKGPLQTRGGLARRLVVTSAPVGMRHAGSVYWSRLSVRAFGGIVEGWTRLQSDGVLIEAAAPESPPARRKGRAPRENVAIDAGPGYITVARSAASSAALANSLSIDMLLLPGGVPIDESVMRIPALWNPDGKPLAPDEVRIQLEPVRHVPGYDAIEADVVLDYVLRDGRGEAACRGSARARATVVDKESVRPPLWDLGVSSLNAYRTRWLALSGPASGVLRAVFDSPAAATSFANWIRASRSAQAGPYQLGLFERSGRKPLRPLVPVDYTAPETFRVLTPQDAEAIRTGPLGEP